MEINNYYEVPYGKLMVYDSAPSPKKLFMYAEQLPGGFIGAIYESCQVYLESGKFPEYQYLHSVCRFATEDEIKQYQQIIETSRFSTNIIKLIKERNIQL